MTPATAATGAAPAPARAAVPGWAAAAGGGGDVAPDFAALLLALGVDAPCVEATLAGEPSSDEPSVAEADGAAPPPIALWPFDGTLPPAQAAAVALPMPAAASTPSPAPVAPSATLPAPAASQPAVVATTAALPPAERAASGPPAAAATPSAPVSATTGLPPAPNELLPPPQAAAAEPRQQRDKGTPPAAPRDPSLAAAPAELRAPVAERADAASVAASASPPADRAAFGANDSAPRELVAPLHHAAALAAATAAHGATLPAAAAAPAGAWFAIAAPLGSAEFAPALSAQVTVLARGGVQQAELRLNPADMGPIAVRIEVADGAQATVHFIADLAATRNVLEAALPELAGALREAGLTLVGGGVSENPQQQQRERLRDVDGSSSGSARRDDVDDLDDGADEDGRATALPAPRRARGVVDLIA